MEIFYVWVHIKMILDIKESFGELVVCMIQCGLCICVGTATPTIFFFKESLILQSGHQKMLWLLWIRHAQSLLLQKSGLVGIVNHTWILYAQCLYICSCIHVAQWKPYAHVLSDREADRLTAQSERQTSIHSHACLQAYTAGRQTGWQHSQKDRQTSIHLHACLQAYTAGRQTGWQHSQKDRQTSIHLHACLQAYTAGRQTGWQHSQKDRQTSIHLHACLQAYTAGRQTGWQHSQKDRQTSIHLRACLQAYTAGRQTGWQHSQRQTDKHTLACMFAGIYMHAWMLPYRKLVGRQACTHSFIHKLLLLYCLLETLHRV